MFDKHSTQRLLCNKQSEDNMQLKTLNRTENLFWTTREFSPRLLRLGAIGIQSDKPDVQTSTLFTNSTVETCYSSRICTFRRVRMFPFRVPWTAEGDEFSVLFICLQLHVDLCLIVAQQSL